MLNGLTLIFLCQLAGIRDARAQGIALGIAAHGFGTAQALDISRPAGAFAGLRLGLAGLLAAFLLLPAVQLLTR